jgi:hypothetical protein
LHLGLVRLGVGDEILEIARRQVLARDQRDRRLGDQRDRRKIGRGVVGRLLVERLVVGMRADAADPHGVAVGPGIGDALGTVHTAGAADVLDDDLLAQNFAHALRHEAAEHVLRSTGGEGNNHRDGSRRIRLRPSEARDDRECGSARDQMQKSTAGTFHDALPGRCSPRATINDRTRRADA